MLHLVENRRIAKLNFVGNNASVFFGVIDDTNYDGSCGWMASGDGPSNESMFSSVASLTPSVVTG